MKETLTGILMLPKLLSSFSRGESNRAIRAVLFRADSRSLRLLFPVVVNVDHGEFALLSVHFKLELTEKTHAEDRFGGNGIDAEIDCIDIVVGKRPDTTTVP
jgi:hypothetical protein